LLGREKKNRKHVGNEGSNDLCLGFEKMSLGETGGKKEIQKKHSNRKKKGAQL